MAVEDRHSADALGVALGAADALRVVLRARGFAIDAETDARISECLDVERLQRWIARAVSAPEVSQVFDDEL